MAERVFALPDLGEGLEEGTVSAWLIAEGDEVELNQPIAEIETAKAVVEMPSPFAGRISKLHVAAGAEARVGEPLVTFDVDDASTDVDEPAASTADARPTTTMMTPAVAHAGVAATPAVRKLAKELGVDLGVVSGSGPSGRITRQDVEAAAGSGVRATSYPASGSETTATAWTVSVDTGVRELPHSPTRRAIADRLAAAAAIPQVTTFRTVDSTALDAFRRELGVSPLPVVIAALTAIVPEHELVNASWTSEAILVHEKVNVGIATDTERGLMVPVLNDAGARGIADIAADITRLANAAREGGLRPPDLAGATIAISNTGSYGSEAGTPLLNPGHAVTLAFGVMEPRALVVDGTVVPRLAATFSLTFDHRVLDGATVGRALTALVDLLESGERLEALPR